MKRIFNAFFVALAVAAVATTALAADYDRYERGYPPSSPPPRAAYARPPQHAVHGETYFFAHLGYFEPNNDNPEPGGGGLGEYDAGGAFDVGIGSRVTPNLAIDATFGGYGAEHKLGSGVGDVSVVPLTFGVRLILPNPIVEPYLGAGLGAYFAHLKEPPFIDDSSVTGGGYLSVGLDAWLNPRLALNFEAKHHWVEPEFNGIDVNVGGWTVGMGVRVSF